MASITIRNLDKKTKERLRVQAALHGRSMEEEVRSILKENLSKDPVKTSNLADAVRKRFEPFGGVELPEIKREPIREPEFPDS